MMRVLIVGCGYVGLPLGAELARQGHEVVGVTRSGARAAELEAHGLEPLTADIARAEELERLPRGMDWVVNTVSSNQGGVEDYRRVYWQGTQNLLQWLQAGPPRKFVYTSSTSVYGQNDGSQVKETSPAEPAEELGQVLAQTDSNIQI
jgi:nucleoside-diphosphate-sugar epimerase